MFVGSAGLWYPEAWPELELGYWWMPESQGRGYATLAAARAKAYAFQELKRETLVSYIDPQNLALIRVAQRLGAVSEGTLELGSHGAHGVHRYSR